jgi:hypothetical protein
MPITFWSEQSLNPTWRTEHTAGLPKFTASWPVAILTEFSETQSLRSHKQRFRSGQTRGVQFFEFSAGN